MTQEDKHDLLIDLSGRLFTDTVVEVKFATENLSTITRIIVPEEGLYYLSPELLSFNQDEIIVKPYLRSMSSMTDEEKEEFHDIGLVDLPSDDYDVYDHKGVEIVSFPWNKRNDFSFDFDDFNTLLNWLNKHHFDYRGLIEMGLAIRVTEKNNPYKNN